MNSFKHNNNDVLGIVKMLVEVRYLLTKAAQKIESNRVKLFSDTLFNEVVKVLIESR